MHSFLDPGKPRCPLYRLSLMTVDGTCPIGKIFAGGSISKDLVFEFDLLDTIELLPTPEPVLEAMHKVVKATKRATHKRRRHFFEKMATQEFQAARMLLEGLSEDHEPMHPDFLWVHGLSAMHEAAARDDSYAVMFLLEHGADKNFRSEAGLTALEYAEAARAPCSVSVLRGETDF
ncbi:unnamed protein product [Periconia digitata]|uniref:Uncharacterized protein n=1 Tax=Periconia digitata TaxID=1303443 RepID=A0A9W4XND5_9PLEO|nr:unnamed protein product [Periconia digitata]